MNKRKSNSNSNLYQPAPFDLPTSTEIISAEPEFDKRIRRIDNKGKTLYSLVDICAEFSDTETDARFYWRDTKKRLKTDGFQLEEKISQLKLKASDGKFYKTDCADAETCLRIVQSIPSPKAERIRNWLASLGRERLEENVSPSLGIERAQNRAAASYQEKGKDTRWIAARLGGIDDRKAFTDALAEHVIEILPQHYRDATNGIYKGLWNGRDTTALKRQLGLTPKQNLRDHQPSAALHYQALVEDTVAEIVGDSDKIYPDQALIIIDQVARMFGLQAAQLSKFKGIDLATGKSLLKDGQS